MASDKEEVQMCKGTALRRPSPCVGLVRVALYQAPAGHTPEFWLVSDVAANQDQ